MISHTATASLVRCTNTGKNHDYLLSTGDSRSGKSPEKKSQESPEENFPDRYSSRATCIGERNFICEVRFQGFDLIYTNERHVSSY